MDNSNTPSIKKLFLKHLFFSSLYATVFLIVDNFFIGIHLYPVDWFRYINGNLILIISLTTLLSGAYVSKQIQEKSSIENRKLYSFLWYFFVAMISSTGIVFVVTMIIIPLLAITFMQQ